MDEVDSEQSFDFAQAFAREMASQVPPRDGLCFMAGSAQNFWEQLYPEERALAATSAERRRQEFATGRHLAHQAMRALGLSPAPVLRGANREPLWPNGVTGSITHTGGLVAVCVSRVERVRSIGVDLEQTDRVRTPTHRKLFTASERAVIRQGEPRLAAVMFAAKEAGYKATHPLGRRYIGFQEAEVDVGWDERQFRLRYLGKHAENAVMESADGRFFFCGPYVLSLVIISNDQ